MRLGRLMTAVGGCCVAAVLALPATAAAGPKSPSTLTLTGYTNAPEFLFTGEVGSPSRKCLGRRKVVFFDDGTKVAKTKSDKRGDFEQFAGELGPGVEDGFSATVKPRRVGSGRSRMFCKPDDAEFRLESYEVGFVSFDLGPDRSQIWLAGQLATMGSVARPECLDTRTIEIRHSDGVNPPTSGVTGFTGSQGDFSIGPLGHGPPGSYDAVVSGTTEKLVADEQTGDLILATCLPTADGQDSNDVEIQNDSPSLSIEYNGDPGEFYGTLSSSEPLCMDGRTIRFFDNDTQTGTRTTNSAGFWKVDPIFADQGHAYRVDSETPGFVGSSSPYTLCQYVQSPTIGF